MPKKTLLAVLCLGASTVVTCRIAFGAPSKPISECAQEYRSREAALRAAGVSAAGFFHECWWHSAPGARTEIGPAQAAPAAAPATARREPGEDARPPVRGQAKTASRPTQVGTRAVPQRRFAAAAEPRGATLRRQRAVVRLARPGAPSRTAARRLATRLAAKRARETYASRATARRDVARLAEQNRKPRDLSERYALRQRRDAYASASARVDDAPFPPGTLEGRRAWIGADTSGGVRKVPAVVIGPLRTTAIHGSALHCWRQDVWFVHASERSNSTALVCDEKMDQPSQKIWLEKFE